MNAADAGREVLTSDPLAVLRQRRWDEVPPQWRPLVYDLRDPDLAEHFSRFYDAPRVLDLRMPDAPELWQRELAWWVFRRASGRLGREHAGLLVRVVRDFNEMARLGSKRARCRHL